MCRDICCCWPANLVRTLPSFIDGLPEAHAGQGIRRLPLLTTLGPTTEQLAEQVVTVSVIVEAAP